MKKFLSVIILLILILALPSEADMLTLSSKQVRHYGIGVVNMPKNYNVYKEPDLNSTVIRTENSRKIRQTAIIDTLDTNRISYLTNIPSKNIALLAVEENIEPNWYNVYLNQKTGETGWVYIENDDDFYTYSSLFYKYGKKYGVHMFNDLEKDKKVLYSKQSTESQKLEHLSYPKHIAFTVIQGNWILLTVSDIARHAKVGWFQWRNDDGTLNMFPNFKE